MVILLQCANGELNLTGDETGWCDVVFLTNGQRHQLGADSVNVILAKLSSALNEQLDGKTSDRIDDVEIKWVLSLSERHCSVYAADIVDRRVLFFQGADGSRLGKLSLTTDERQGWREQLQRQGGG